MTLTEFLLARIAEDEEIAREATHDGHKWLVEEETISLWPDDLEPATGNIHFPRKAHAYHAAAWEPARVLAECEAKRRIVDRHSGVKNGWSEVDGEPMRSCGHDWKDWPCPDLLDLALPYADHPDYQPEWKP